MTKKKGDAGPPSRRSLRLAEQARQEMLRQRKLAHGGQEVGDTSEDPLPIPSDEEKEATPPSLPGAKIGSPLNPDYDSDYVEFMTEFLADDSLGDTPPASPATPDTAFPSVPSTAFEADRPSPPSQTPSMERGSGDVAGSPLVVVEGTSDGGPGSRSCLLLPSDAGAGELSSLEGEKRRRRYYCRYFAFDGGSPPLLPPWCTAKLAADHHCHASCIAEENRHYHRMEDVEGGKTTGDHPCELLDVVVD
nr:uncharacterized protein LOC109166971 [Ipomoea trifida]